MKYSFLLLILLLTLQTSFAQDYVNSIRVEVQNGAQKPFEGIRVQLFQEDSVLYTDYTDTAGLVILHHALDTIHEYFLQVLETTSNFQRNREIPIEVNYNDSLKAYENMDFYFLFNLGGCTLYEYDRSFIAFQPYSAKKITNNEIDFLKSLMEEYPDMCVMLHQNKLKDESNKLAKKRQKALFKILQQEGVDMERITFDEHVYSLNTEGNLNTIPKFEISVLSMDGNCK